MTSDALRRVAEECFGPDGLWLYDAFEAINEAYFANELPLPLITIQITSHGRCLGWTKKGSLSWRPHIAIHPTLFGQRGKKTPWGYPTKWLGRAMAFDVLLHEAIHVSVHYLLGGATGPTSHNNPQWVREVNRLCPLLGFSGIEAGRQVSRRVLTDDGETTKTGKPKKDVKKVTDGNVPYLLGVAGFPSGLREHLGTADAYYMAGKLPLDV
jgi:hypothetical protein